MSKYWWTKKWGKDKVCPITQTRVRPGKNIIGVYHTSRLPCDHYFCTYPLLNWMEKGQSFESTCPMCRSKFNMIDLIK